MNDIRQLLERQVEWQKNRVRLTWPEKIRQAEAMRETLRRFRSLKTKQQGSEKGSSK